MNKAQAAARKLCPRTCLDCCCEVHHFGDYGDEENEDVVLSCKHCPAALEAEEVCTRCEAALIEHDLGNLDCQDEKGKFHYEGQPVRVCKQVHPWDGEERREI